MTKLKYESDNPCPMNSYIAMPSQAKPLTRRVPRSDANLEAADGLEFHVDVTF